MKNSGCRDDRQSSGFSGPVPPGEGAGRGKGLRCMGKHPVLDMRLDEVMKDDIALPLQHVLKLYTVGNFLNAWRNPKNHKSIEQVFETPEQARHAVAVCAAFLGVNAGNIPHGVQEWWAN